MRFLAASLFAATVACALVAACGSDSTSGSPADAGPEATTGDAGKEGGCPFGCNVPDSGDDGGDAGSRTCAQLKMQVDQLSAAARKCNPNGSQECAGKTDGICCSISVSSGNAAAIDDYDHAVAAYKATCMVDCTGIICPMNVPSMACNAVMGSPTGICE